MTGSDAFVRAVDRGLADQARRWGYRYAVTPRSGHPLPAKLPVGVEVMPLSGGEESSTSIRQQLREQRLPGKLLPDTAARYIRQHRLYGYRGSK